MRYAKLEKMEYYDAKLLKNIFLHFTKEIMDEKSLAKLIDVNVEKTLHIPNRILLGFVCRG